jgi:hypothetical protein
MSWISLRKDPAMNFPPNALHKHQTKEGSLILYFGSTLTFGFFHKKINKNFSESIFGILYFRYQSQFFSFI